MSGLSRLEISNDRNSKFQQVGNQLLQKQSAELSTQIQVFHAALQEFGTTHAKEIQSNPVFRNSFLKMCSALNIDPFVSSKKQKRSIWNQVFGESMNDFYLKLSVRVIELCRNSHDGGLTSMDYVISSINKENEGQVEGAAVTRDDVERSIKLLQPLGKGFSVVDLSGDVYIQSKPLMFNSDQKTILNVCKTLGGWTSVAILEHNLSWSSIKSETLIKELVGQGILWIDITDTEVLYWIPT